MVRVTGPPGERARISDAALALQVTGLLSTAMMTSPRRTTPSAGNPFSTTATVSTAWNLIPSSHSAAAVAVCCELVICCVSCRTTCCWVWPGPNSSSCGTTALCGVSQARRAAKTLSDSDGPPWNDTVVRFRCPLVGYVGWPAISISDRPPGPSPSVLRVGPGLRITYGTGRMIAATAAATTPETATYKVSWRREVARRLRIADPLTRAVAEVLLFPDRHAVLQVVDQGAARPERLAAVRAGDGHHDREITHGQLPDPVHGGQRPHVEVRRHLFGHDPQLGRCGRVRTVGQPGNFTGPVMVADRAHEQRDAACSRIGDGDPYLVHRQRRIPQLGDPDHVHGAKVPVTGS